MEHPAGKADDGSLRIECDHRLKLEFHGGRITSDAGLLAYRKLDDALGLSESVAATLLECRRGENIRHLLSGLFRIGDHLAVREAAGAVVALPLLSDRTVGIYRPSQMLGQTGSMGNVG
jgi:hypothetical protein